MSVIEGATNLPDRLGVRADRSAEQLRRDVAYWQSRYRRGILVTDLAVGAVAAAMAFTVRFGEPGEFSVAYLLCSLVFPIVWFVLLGLVRAHEPRFLFVGTEEFRRVVVAGAALMVGIAVVSYAGKIEVARGWVLLSIPTVTLATLGMRYAWRRQLQKRRAARGDCMHRAIAVGYELGAATLFRTLQANPRHGLDLVGICLPKAHAAASGGSIADCPLPVLGDFDDVVSAVERTGADVVVVLACPELDGIALRRLAWALEKTDTELLVAPALLDVAGPRVTVRPVADLPLLHVEHTELTHWRRMLKAGFDRAGAALGLLLLLPVMLAIAAAVKLTDRGPVFFRQERIGYDGNAFSMLKFRSMHVGAEDRLERMLEKSDTKSVLFKMHDDPRVTAVGRFIRRYSLDELPQLVNVLLGHMSLVGPRPPLPREVAQYERDVHRRFAVRPGITGLWQVSGRSDLAWEEAVRLDIRYVERWSLLLDLLIICRTFGAVLRKSGAY